MGANVSVPPTSPYMYFATASFFVSAFSSDLLFIRLALTFGFLGLVLATNSGFSTDGSFSFATWGLYNGLIDVTMLVNAFLCLLNLYVSVRLMDDERPRDKLTEEERALYRLFHSRCGCTYLQFHEILKHGKFMDLPANSEVPHVGSTLYLVLQGKVEITTKFNEDDDHFNTFFKRSGEFFDIKMFNVFTIPVGFDNYFYQANTVMKTRVFCWDLEGLKKMRDSFSPDLKPFWEYMVLRCLTNVAIRHHLKDSGTYYDSWLVPEDAAWLEGAPSRDFAKPPPGEWDHFKVQLRVLLKDTFMNIIPPRGVRHQAGLVEQNPKEAYMKLISKAHNSKEFNFLCSSVRTSQTMNVYELETQLSQLATIDEKSPSEVPPRGKGSQESLYQVAPVDASM